MEKAKQKKLKKWPEVKYFNKKVANSCGSEGFVRKDEERQGKFIQLRILLKQNTALLSTVRPCVTSVTSHISHIYKGINAMLIIRSGDPSTLYILNQNHSGYVSSKDQTGQDHLLRPDQPNHWFWLIKRIIKKINAESALFTLSCLSCHVSISSMIQ